MRIFEEGGEILLERDFIVLYELSIDQFTVEQAYHDWVTGEEVEYLTYANLVEVFDTGPGYRDKNLTVVVDLCNCILHNSKEHEVFEALTVLKLLIAFPIQDSRDRLAVEPQFPQ